MSWQAYIDTSLVGSGHIDKAAIFNADGNSVWASSEGFTVKPEDMAVVAAHFKENEPKDGEFYKIQGSGFDIGGDHYVTLKAGKRELYGKKGKEGMVIVKTQQAILVAHYPDGVQPGNATNTVETLGDYLIDLGF